MARRSRRRMSYTSKRRTPPRGRKGRFTKSARRVSFVARGAKGVPASAGASRSGKAIPTLLIVGLAVGGGLWFMSRRKQQQRQQALAIMAAQQQAAAARGAPFPTQTTSSVPAMLAPAAKGYIESMMDMFKPAP